MAAVLGVLAVAVALLRRIRSASSGAPDRAPSTAALACLQVAGFSAMEVVERLVAGAPVGSLFHHHVFLVGVVVQLAVAAILALALRSLERIADRAYGSLASPARRLARSARTLGPALLLPARSPALAGGSGPRAPPRA